MPCSSCQALRHRVRVGRTAATSDGTRCRTPRHAAGPGTVAGRPRCPRGWRDCATAPAEPGRSTAAINSSSTSDRRREPVAAVDDPVARRQRCPPDLARDHASRTPVRRPPARPRDRPPPDRRRCRPSRPAMHVAGSAPRRCCSTSPVAAASPDLASTRLYFSDEDPALITRTCPSSRCLSDCCAWIAVIATVLMMSRTVAPRDRSLTGFRRPCRTGPTATAFAERCTALYVLLPVLRSGNTNTVARPATGESGSFVRATALSIAASYWIGPSTSSSRRALPDDRALPWTPSRRRCRCRTCRSSTTASRPAARPRTRRPSRPTRSRCRRAARRVGSGFTAQSPYTRTWFSRHMKNTDETTDTPGQRLHHLEGRPDRVGGGVHRPRHHPVGEPELHHHRAEVRDVPDQLAGLIEVDAAMLPEPVVLRREPLRQLARPPG